MSVLFRIFVLLLVLGSVAQASTAPALAGNSLPPNSAFSELTLATNVLQMGTDGNLHVTLKHATNQLTILTLTITYPNGSTQSVVHSTLGKEATLEWTVPAATGIGRATYQIALGGCGCGEHNAVQPDAAQTVATGAFTVE
ncbi:MAG: hypothetical protein U0350_20990 [Caldilineaceae bacterium]